MTIRQLFQSVPFDRLVSFIKQSDQPHDIFHYKQAYDILLNMPPYDEGGYCVEVSSCIDHDGTRYINASQIEGCKWRECIDGKVVVENGIKVTDEELAFRLLWHLTFFGYSPKESSETIDNLGNDEYHETVYGVKARELEHKRYMLWANKAIKRQIQESIDQNQSEGMNMFSLPEEDWAYIEKREKHCNRMKRMRDHRLSMRQEELANLDRCEHTIQRLLENQISTLVTKDDLTFLFNNKGRSGTEFQTRAYDVNKRLSYLDELISKYGALDTIKHITKVVLRISTSSKHPLSDGEYDQITSKVTTFIGKKPLLIRTVDEHLEEEIGIMIVGPNK